MPRAVQPSFRDPSPRELQHRVDRAREDYERVLEAGRKLIERMGSSELMDTERLAAVRNARRIQDMATQRYAEALEVFSDFVLGRQTANRSQ